jgi:hypothetical protein
MRNHVLWSIEEDSNGFIPTLDRDSTSSVMEALIKLKGRLHYSELTEMGVIYQIALPEGSRETFEKLAGYLLSYCTERGATMKQDMIDKAYDLAREGLAKGQKCVMILFSTQAWHHTPRPEEGIHVRYSDTPSGLESLSVDTLITVGDAKEFSREGFDYIWDRMRVGSGTKVTGVTDDWPCFPPTKTFWRKTYIGLPDGLMGGEAELSRKYRSLEKLIKDHGTHPCEKYVLVSEATTKFTFEELEQFQREGVTSCEEVNQRMWRNNDESV